MLSDLLTPKPFRGDVIAAGAIVLLLAAGLFELRAVDHTTAGVRLAVLGPVWLFVLVLAWRAPIERVEPRSYQSLLYIASLILALLALAALSQALGARGWLAADATRCWILAALSLHAAAFAKARRSGVCTLLAAVGVVGLVVAADRWAAGPSGALGLLRWLLLALSVLYVLCAVRLRDRWRHQGVAFVEAAGLTLVALAITWNGVLLPLPGGDGALPLLAGEPAGSTAICWTVLLLVCGLGLVGYGGADRERGPVWIGALLLLHFAALESGGALYGWPLVLLVVATALLVVGLRPTTPSPPAPDEGLPVGEPLPFPRA